MLTHKRLAVVYASITVCAALVYWTIWMRHPDYFVVQQETNLYPLRTIETLVQTEHIPTVTTSLEGLGDLSRKAADLIGVAQRIRAEREQVTKDIQSLEQDAAAASTVMSEKKKALINQIIDREMGSLLADRSRLAKKMEEIEKNATTEPRSYRKAGIDIAELRVQLGRVENDIAQKERGLLVQLLRETRQLDRDEDIGKRHQIEKQVEVAREALRILDNKWLDHRKNAGIALGEWYSARTAKLTLLDFFYFSLGVSTTTTFGDIIPNHSAVRAVVVVQLLSTLVLVGLIINSLWHQYGIRRQ